MVSPWPPSTKATTSEAETFSACATKVRKRAVSRMPAIPTTRCLGKPLTRCATWHMASSGLVTTIRMQSGEYFTACSTLALTMS